MAYKAWPLLSGLATAANHMTCPPGFFMQMDDWVIEYGRLRPRFGSTIVNSSPSPLVASGAVDCGIFYKDVNSPTNGGVSIIQLSGKIFRSAQYTGDTQYLTNSNVAFTDITGTATPSVAGSAGMADVLNNVVILTSLTGSPSQVTSDSSNAAPLAGSPPAGICVKVVNNFAFLAAVNNGGTNSSRIFWSNVGDPQTWTATNFLDWRTNDADYIVALSAIAQDLLVFKNGHIGRLSTQTITTSGAVTLGPFTTLYDGIGCAGYRAVDTLPDGRCVFLGSDWNVYTTDGFSVQLLSRGPFGSPNIYTNGFSNGLFNYSKTGARFTNSPSLFVHPTRTEIWIGVQSNAATLAGAITFIYDYVQNYWRRVTGHAIGTTYKLTPIRGGASIGTGRPYRVIAGMNGDVTNTNLIALDNENVTTPTDDTGAVITATAIFSVADPAIVSEQQFRSINIPSTNSGTTAVTFGFDGTLNGASTKNLSASTIRNVIPIPFQTPSNMVRDSSFQVKLTDTNSNNLIYTPIFSDEIIA